MFEQTNCIVLTNIIDVMFNIFEVRIMMMRNLSTTTMSNREKDAKRVQLGKEAYQAWLNQPPIQFPLRLDSPIRNAYNNNNSSHVDKGI